MGILLGILLILCYNIISIIVLKNVCICLQFSTDLEKNKLFIQGLSYATTKEEVEKIFGEVSFIYVF